MKIRNCRVCGGELSLILSLGKIPVVNYFPSFEELQSEKKYPLEIFVCKECSLVQLGYLLNGSKLFKNYHFLSSASTPLVGHLDSLAERIISTFSLATGSSVLDIGCNDGSLLSSFKKRDFDVMGVEPSSNAISIARDKGIPVVNDFFNFKVAQKLVKQNHKFDLVTATRVLANIDDLNDFLTGVSTVLTEKGIFVIEVAAFDEMIERGEFDTFYHEHLSYFTPESIAYLFRKNNLKIVFQERTGFQGGELRVAAIPVASSLPAISTVNLSNYLSFSQNVVDYRLKMQKLFADIKGSRVVGFGAPAKGVTLLNYCKLGSEQIQYIVDSTPLKQGRYLPGVHIPIFPEEYMKKGNVDYVFLLAWNYKDAILEKVKSLTKTGTKVIIPYPSLEIIKI